jgi:hypothetical protein
MTKNIFISKDVVFDESHLWLSMLKLKEAMEESKMTLPLFIFLEEENHM